MPSKLIRNEDVESVVVEVPEGHAHIRTTIRLADGTELTMQEATVSNILRAFTTVKTHPIKTRVALKRVELSKEEGTAGYAAHQLMEADE